MKKKTLFRIAIQEFVDGKPKKYSNITVKEGDSFDKIHKMIDEKLINHLFKTQRGNDNVRNFGMSDSENID